jgi:hypothetical protein
MSVDSNLQGLGVGTRAIEYAIGLMPGYTWYTTIQYKTAESFWKRIAQRTSAGFSGPQPVSSKCKHMCDS